MENNLADAIRFESVIMRYQGFRGHYIDVPAEVSRHFSSPRNLRLLCSIEGEEEFHCALRPKGSGDFEISVGTPVRKAGKLRLGQKVAVSLRPDHSTYGRPMPEELAELLAIDEEGDKLFHAAKPGTQRDILYYINNGRTVQTRIDRAILMIGRLKNKGFS